MVSSSTKSLHNRQLAEINRLKYEARQAADTIERLQKERDQLGAGGKVWQRTAGQLKQERDAALAEVERLKGQLQAAETSIQAHRGFVRS